jgi:hypothetical protein
MLAQYSLCTRTGMIRYICVQLFDDFDHLWRYSKLCKDLTEQFLIYCVVGLDKVNEQFVSFLVVFLQCLQCCLQCECDIGALFAKQGATLFVKSKFGEALGESCGNDGGDTSCSDVS